MYHVLDHDDIVYSGEFSESTEYVLEHYGMRFDDAIRSGIMILYTDPMHSLNEARQAALGYGSRAFWSPVEEEWKLD